MKNSEGIRKKHDDEDVIINGKRKIVEAISHELKRVKITVDLPDLATQPKSKIVL